MTKKEPEQFFDELKNDITTWTELKVELLKLEAYERTGKIISVLSFGLIILLLLFSVILFAFVALGFLLSGWFHSFGIGFSVAAILYILLIGIVYLFKNQIRLQILNAIIAAFMAHDKKETNDETDSTDPLSHTSA